jgi:hypothetical protein
MQSGGSSLTLPQKVCELLKLHGVTYFVVAAEGISNPTLISVTVVILV